MVMGLDFRRPGYHLSDWQNINGEEIFSMKLVVLLRIAADGLEKAKNTLSKPAK